jgi:hypothetical protein
MKNVVKLHHYSPTELEAALEEFVNRYNNDYHESLKTSLQLTFTSEEPTKSLKRGQKSKSRRF